MPLEILALEPYAARSHREFLAGLSRYSQHRWDVLSLPARKWKWRLRTSSLHYARAILDRDRRPDLLFVSDFVNLAELQALLSGHGVHLPAAIYFHENQLTYPLQPGEAVDYQFALTHFHAMLTAGGIAFNSEYHRREFMNALAALLRLVPDVETRAWFESLGDKTVVLPLGTDAPRHPPSAVDPSPTLLWNHRWEYDKNPPAFLAALEELVESGEDFRVRLLGERFRTLPAELVRLQALLGPRLIDDGFVESRSQYLERVASAHIAVSTAHHEFFGLGTLEAIRSGLLPIVPDDLAYPELLPPDPAPRELCLYSRDENLADRLARALDVVRTGARSDDRGALVNFTDRFAWPELVESYDSWLESVIDRSR